MVTSASTCSTSGSQSPASSSPSTNTSPASHSSPLSMARAPEETPTQPPPRNSNRLSVDLPRTQTASKGGCWTCRLRRKKCDEQRDGDSCQTCLRLKIDCLGWGSRRPEWMRDKQAVEKYKADIKAQLTRAGLIRGQPRASSSNIIHTVPSNAVAPIQSYMGLSSHGTHSPPTSTRAEPPNTDYIYRGYIDSSPHGHHTQMMLPSLPAPNTNGLSMSPFTDPALETLSLSGPSPFPYTNSPTPPSTGHLDPSHFDLFPSMSPNVQFNFEVPSTPMSPLAGQNSVQGNCVVYYFEHVRKMQFIFAGNAVTNVTYSLILQEPQSAVTNAVCALASLHYARSRVAQGLEAPDLHPENSPSRYFHDEALLQITSSKQMCGHYSESDAIALLHLISFSLFSGGDTDWQVALRMGCEWLAQTGIVVNENPKLTLLNMNAASKLAVKAIMWMDIMSCLSVRRPSKYLSFYRRLLSGGHGYWAGFSSDSHNNYDLRMESLSGLPDEVLLGIAEVTALSCWKAQEKQNGSLSVRELVRRGDSIEQQIRSSNSDLLPFMELEPVALHPGLPTPPTTASSMLSSTSMTQSGSGSSFPSDDTRRMVASIFRESVILYLHTVVSEGNPGVPEISTTVDVIIQLLTQLEQTEVDRTLVFPICLAGCMTDNLGQREFLKRRLQSHDENIGNLLQTRTLMEAVWQRRSISAGHVDWHELMQERGLSLLLI